MFDGGRKDRCVLIIDGAYLDIGARTLETKRKTARLSYMKLRAQLEEMIGTRFLECWYYNQYNSSKHYPNESLHPRYRQMKLAPPNGPQFQLKLYHMKEYKCHCPDCGHRFHQLVQKGVDNGIATKILSLAYENVYDRVLLLAGDGDFYDSLDQVRNVLRKDIWVIGYESSMSPDLQQVSSRVIWMEDIWDNVVESPTLIENHSSRSKTDLEDPRRSRTGISAPVPRPAPPPRPPLRTLNVSNPAPPRPPSQDSSHLVPSFSNVADRRLHEAIELSKHVEELWKTKVEKERDLTLALSIPKPSRPAEFDPDEPWDCPVCTFKNNGTRSTCFMCLHPREK